MLVRDLKALLIAHFTERLKEPSVIANRFRAAAFKSAIGIISSWNCVADVNASLATAWKTDSSVRQQIILTIGVNQLTDPAPEASPHMTDEVYAAACALAPVVASYPRERVSELVGQSLEECAGWGSATVKRYWTDPSVTVGQALVALHLRRLPIPESLRMGIVHFIETQDPLNRKHVQRVVKELCGNNPDSFIPVGSFRRGKTLMKDLDILTVIPDNTPLATWVQVQLSEAKGLILLDTICSGNARVSVYLRFVDPKIRRGCFQVDFFGCKLDNLGPALYHHTGPYTFNVAFRKEVKARVIELIKSKGATPEDVEWVRHELTVSQYGLSLANQLSTRFGIPRRHFAESNDINAHERIWVNSLGLVWVSPEDRAQV